MNKDIYARIRPLPNKLVYENTPAYKNDDAFDFTLEDESEIDEATLEELNDTIPYEQDMDELTNFKDWDD